MYRVYEANNKNTFVETDDFWCAVDMAFDYFEKYGFIMIVADRKGNRWAKCAVIDHSR